MLIDLRGAAGRLRRVVQPVFLLVLALTLGLGSWPPSLVPPAGAAPGGDIIRIGPDGWQFVDGRGNRFTPFGCTYADPATWPPEKRDDRWEAGKTGPAVIEAFDPVRTDRHFQLLSETAQASVVRIFLSPAVFEPTLGRFDDVAFKKLDKIVALAAQRNLRLILDIAEVWEGQAPWMIADGLVDFYANDTAIYGVSLFAAELGRRYRDNPTIFAWNLQNEPFVLGADSPFMRSKYRTWLRQRYPTEEALRAAWPDFPRPGERWPDAIAFPDFAGDLPNDQRLYDFQLFREYIATRWTARVSRALRAQDPNHLITLGLIQFSSPIRDGKVWGWSYPGVSPQAVAPYVDFISMHGYVWNYEDRFDYIPGVLRYAYSGKPVVLEEFRYDDSVIEATVGSAAGWLSWWCFDDPEKRPHESLFDLDGNATPEGKAFANKALDLYQRPSLVRSSGLVGMGVERRPLLTSGSERDNFYARYVAESRQRPVDFTLVPEPITDVPWQMSISVSAAARVIPGQPVSYSLTYTNPLLGPPLATDVVISATLDTSLVSFQRASPGARFQPQLGTVVFKSDDVRAGAVRTVQIDGLVSPDAKPGQAIVMRAVLTAREEPALPEVLGISIAVPPGIPSEREPYDLAAALGQWLGLKTARR